MGDTLTAACASWASATGSWARSGGWAMMAMELVTIGD